MAGVSPFPNTSRPDESPNNDPETNITSTVAMLQDHACQLGVPSTPFPGDQINVGGQGNFAAAHCTFNVTIHHNSPNSASVQSTPPMVKGSSKRGATSPHISKTPPANDPVSRSSEKRKVIVVAPFGSEIEHDSEDGMIMTVWFCWNESNDYQEILKSEHKNGKIILESYDTFAMHCNGDKQSKDKIQVSITSELSSSWTLEGNGRKEILPQNVCLGKKVKRSFRLKRRQPVRDGGDHLYLILTISQLVSEGRREIQFILRKKTQALRMTAQMKTALEDVASEADVKGKTTRAFLAAPFVDVMKEVKDNIILSIWLCPSDDENILFKKLEKEQEIQRKFQLDSPTSFIPSSSDKPISSEIKVHSERWTIKPSHQQEMEIFKLSNGGRAKFLFLCHATDNLDKTDIDIFLRQRGEKTETEFITSANVKSLQIKTDGIETPSNNTPGNSEVTQKKADVRERVRRMFSSLMSQTLAPSDGAPSDEAYSEERALRPGSGKRSPPPALPRPYSEANSGAYSEANSGAYSEANSGAYSEANSGAYSEANSGAYSEANSGAYSEEFNAVLLKEWRVVKEWRVALALPPSAVICVLTLVKLEDDDESSFTVTLMLCQMSSLATQLESLQDSGCILLDSYDTCILRYYPGNFPRNKLKVSYSDPAGTLATKTLDVADILRKSVASCSFQCNGDLTAGVYGTLEASTSDVSTETLKLKQRFTIHEEKLRKFKNMKAQITSYNFPIGVPEDQKIYMAVPYIDSIRNMSDDVVITVWICSFFRKGEIEQLAIEQDIFGRIKLDTENSFLMIGMRQSIEVEVTLPRGWSTDDNRKEIELMRLTEGYRAKVQFLCKTSGMQDQRSFVDIDITMRQRRTPNEIQFLTRKKMASFFRQTQTDAGAEPGQIAS